MEVVKVVGYIASDSFADGFVSHQIQNLTIKNFLSHLNKTFLLSWTEYKGKSGIVLKSLLEEDFYEGICLYSMEQLWHSQNPLHILENFKAKGLWVGFAKEGIFFHSSEEFQKFLKIYWLKTQIEKNQSSWEN